MIAAWISPFILNAVVYRLIKMKKISPKGGELTNNLVYCAIKFMCVCFYSVLALLLVLWSISTYMYSWLQCNCVVVSIAKALAIFSGKQIIVICFYFWQYIVCWLFVVFLRSGWVDQEYKISWFRSRRNAMCQQLWLGFNDECTSVNL